MVGHKQVQQAQQWERNCCLFKPHDSTYRLDSCKTAPCYLLMHNQHNLYLWKDRARILSDNGEHRHKHQSLMTNEKIC